MKKHLKRLSAPRSWRIARKTAVWATKPAPGPHRTEMCVPVLNVLRDMLRYCDTGREARTILGTRTVQVDGRVVTDPKFGVGVMDVLAIRETKEHYRMLIDTLGRLHLVPIQPEDAGWKLCRIENKTTVKGGKIQLNMHDGRNLVFPKSTYATGTTLKLEIPQQKVLAEFPLAPGVVSLMIGGQHVGEIANVERVERTRNPRANVVYFREGFSTNIDKVFVVGRATAEIPIPEVSAVEVRT